MDAASFNPLPQTVAVADVGQRLTNGATVLAASAMHDRSDDFIPHGYVLCVTEDGTYASWCYRLNTASCHAGEYRRSLTEAIEIFRRRCDKARLEIVVGL